MSNTGLPIDAVRLEDIPALSPQALQGWNTCRGKAGTLRDPTYVAVLRWARAVMATGKVTSVLDLFLRRSPTDVLSLRGYYPREFAVPLKDTELYGWAGLLTFVSRGPLIRREGDIFLPTPVLDAQLQRVGEHRSHLPSLV